MNSRLSRAWYARPRDRPRFFARAGLCYRRHQRCRLTTCCVPTPPFRGARTSVGWAPRDVVAHLIGWNRLMIQASKSILAGHQPAYYSDALNDYRNINAAFIKQHLSRTKQELLHELHSSMRDFDSYVASRPGSALSSDHRDMHY